MKAKLQKLGLQSAGGLFLVLGRNHDRRATSIGSAWSTPDAQVRHVVGLTIPQDIDRHLRIQSCRGTISEAEPVRDRIVRTFRDVEAQTAVRARNHVEDHGQGQVGIGDLFVPPGAELILIAPNLTVQGAGLTIRIRDFHKHVAGGLDHTAVFIDLPIAVVVETVAADFRRVDDGTLAAAEIGRTDECAIAAALPNAVHRADTVLAGT